MATILSGDATPAQLIGFVVALRAKGETPEELQRPARRGAGRGDLVPLDATSCAREPSTSSAPAATAATRSTSARWRRIVVAGAGVPVCKHGARAASSQCGTADVLEELGVAIELSPEGVLRCVEQVGIGFCLAPKFHPAFRFAAAAPRDRHRDRVQPARPDGQPRPRSPPAHRRCQPGFAERMLGALRLHGSERAWVVHGGGLDELTTTGTSTVLALDDDSVETFTVDPVDSGSRRRSPTSWSVAARRERRGRAPGAEGRARRAPQHRVAQRRRRPGGGG